MAPTNKEHVLKIVVFHYRKEGVSEADFHRFLTKTHAHDAVPLHSVYSVLKWSMISDHDGYVTYYARSTEHLIEEMKDPGWERKIHAEGVKWAGIGRGYGSVFPIVDVQLDR